MTRHLLLFFAVVELGTSCFWEAKADIWKYIHTIFYQIPF